MKRESEYAIVSWSESQRLMEIEDWEKHRFLITDGAGIKQYGCCAYAAEKNWLENNLTAAKGSTLTRP